MHSWALRLNTASCWQQTATLADQGRVEEAAAEVVAVVVVALRPAGHLSAGPAQVAAAAAATPGPDSAATAGAALATTVSGCAGQLQLPYTQNVLLLPECMLPGQ
jgi:hypothetical protein